MARTTTMTVRIGETLGDYVARQIGDNGPYENVSEYVRDLIRKDKERHDKQAFNRLKAELQLAFSEPDESYITVSAADIISRNKNKS